MKNAYLVRPDVPEDWVDATVTDSETSVCLLTPVGPHDMLEVRDGIYRQGKGEPYHQHDIGTEIFYLAEGRVEATIRGKTCTVNAGDMVFIAQGVPHGLRFPDRQTTWRVFLQGMNVYRRRIARNTIAAHYPQLMDDPEFCAMFARENGSFPREPAVARPARPGELPELRTPDFGWSEFELPGALLRQVVGRWETGGLYEVWRVQARRGLSVRWDDPHPDWELYQVTRGRVRFEVLGETFEATDGQLVRIPPYTAHALRVLSDEAVVHDMGCPIRLLSLLEDRLSLAQHRPQVLQDPQTRRAFLRKHRCFVTDWRMD